MTVKTMEPSRVLSLGDHLIQAAGFDKDQAERIRRLAAQLAGRPVLPLLGAGASYDCGMRLATEIGRDLYDDYMSNGAYAPHARGLEPNLGDVADAIYDAADQVAVVRAVGLPDPALWPGADDISDHFCAYRVLARLAREELMAEVMTFNYDCGHEAGLKDEGFMWSPRTERGKQWLDHATVVSDAATYAELRLPGSLKLIKAHGCAQRYRALAASDEEAAAATIVITNLQLATWRNDLWIRDAFRDRARSHILLLIGFSGQDTIIYGALNEVLDDVYSNAPIDGDPRVVVVDWQPDSVRLRTLITTGLGNQPAAAGAVTQVETASGTTTAALLILLAETLALKLSTQPITIPDDIDARLAMLTLAAPAALRWAYQLRRSQENQYLQKVNLQQAAERGYVPLTLDPGTTARALNSRADLRAALGMPLHETTAEALASDGFIIDGGFAYLPIGLDQVELVGACRPGGPIEHTRRALPHPRHLECILVSDGPGGRQGVHIDTGREVSVP
jgi:hypothetical protein